MVRLLPGKDLSGIGHVARQVGNNLPRADYNHLGLLVPPVPGDLDLDRLAVADVLEARDHARADDFRSSFMKVLVPGLGQPVQTRRQG